MKRERLEWLADNPLYTHRYAIRIGRLCRLATIKDVSEDCHLDWHAVKDLDKQYMHEQLDREGLNNKIRTIQKKAYAYRDEEYLRLKILTCTLPKY